MGDRIGHPKPLPVEQPPRQRIARKAIKRTKMKAVRKHAHPAWRKLRAAVLKRDQGWCQVCDEAEAVEVHHRSYAKGRGVKGLLVPLDQLVSVCRRCHEAQHEWMRKEKAA